MSYLERSRTFNAIGSSSQSGHPKREIATATGVAATQVANTLDAQETGRLLHCQLRDDGSPLLRRHS